MRLLKDEEAPEEARMIAVNLLREMESTLPKMLYITWQLNRDGRDDLKDNALEALTEMGECVVQPILQELPKANEAGEEALLEVLSHFPGNEQIFKLAVRLFKERKERRALFAGYLAKLGDDRALPELTAAAEETKLPYLTFIEIRNAIETLGGTCPERSYEDDPEYEALRRLMLPYFRLDPHAINGEYMIRSLYFDDYYGSAYEEKEMGKNSEYQLRIRGHRL